MVRRAVFLVVVLVGGCTSAVETPAPACQIAGTYAMTATPETQSEGCADLGSSSGPTTVTLTELESGYGVEMQGSQGACLATVVESCKLQAKCDLQVTDAINPADAVGTLQFSWTFDSAGFKGINSGAMPRATSLPRGCTFTSNATGSRR